MTRRDYTATVKLLEANAGNRHMLDVFRDFAAMFALAIRNTVDRAGWQKREDEYLTIAGHYSREELDRFAEAFAHITAIMTDEPEDVFGRLYMEANIANERLGQFYTPYDLAKLTAALTAPDLIRQAGEGPARVHEPACGAGAFLIALVECLHENGFNAQQRLHVDAEDISITAVHMTYIHLSLLHIPARVAHRDTLTGETWDVWETPAHILGGWNARLTFPAVQALTQAPDIPGLPDEPAPEPATTLF